VETEKLIESRSKENLSRGEDSASIRKRVLRARTIQNKRFSGLGIQVNAKMRNKEVKKFCILSPQVQLILKQAVNSFRLSARAYFRVIKVSRTIADLAGSGEIKPEHVAEALQYRARYDI